MSQYTIVPTHQYVLKAGSEFHVTLGGVTYTNFEGVPHDMIFDTCVVGPDVPAQGEAAGYTSVYLAKDGTIITAKRDCVTVRPITQPATRQTQTAARRPAGDTPCPKCKATGTWTNPNNGAARPCNVCDGLGVTSAEKAHIHNEKYASYSN